MLRTRRSVRAGASVLRDLKAFMCSIALSPSRPNAAVQRLEVVSVSAPRLGLRARARGTALPKDPSTKRKKATAAIAPLPDRRALESLLAELGGNAGSSDVEAAQEIMWDAWGSDDRRRRVALAKKALKLSPLCADAYVLLAQETARSVNDALQLYRHGVKAGEKALGKAAFRDDVGHFWGILETRPYMRARQGLARSLWESGAREEAVTHYQDMLRLNPNDNQGVRYILLDCLLALGRDGDADKLLRRYKDDGAAACVWSGALAVFRREGECLASRKALARAVRTNGHVPAYLLGRKKLPHDLPALIGMGGEDEAVAYVHDSAPAWAATPNALQWVGAVLF
jgi:tetratricopeptide (TPR) repeat protein